jgi:prefoldin subunit 5
MEEEQAVAILKTEITALKQQNVANQHEIRTKDDRIDQLIREIRNLVSISVLQI